MPSRKRNMAGGKSSRGAKTKRDTVRSIGAPRVNDNAKYEEQERQQIEKREDFGQGERPSCWICLCDEPDEDGSPLVRDCSCRGHAGFAHLSCIIRYAKVKSVDADEVDKYDVNKFAKPWAICHNCDQGYQHEIALYLADSLLSFIEDASSLPLAPEDECPKHGVVVIFKVVEALKLKIHAIRTMNWKKSADLREIGKKTAARILTIIKHAEKCACREQVARRKLFAYNCLGNFAVVEGNIEGYKQALEYYHKSRKCYESIGESTDTLDAMISSIKAHSEGNKRAMQDIGLKTLQQVRKEYGKNDGRVESGMALAQALKQLHLSIECERALIDVAAISRRVHGPEHSSTQSTESLLNFHMQRRVCLIGVDGSAMFQALRYEDDQDKCVVQGPFSSARDTKNEEKTFIVENNRIFLTPGTPVISRHELNLIGEIGDLRAGYNVDRDEYKVYWEDKSRKPGWVRRKHLRIVFDLPNAEGQ